MADYVLVHGGSVTGSVWDNVKPLLEARGHRVFTPTLADERTSSLTDHIDEVCKLTTGDDLRSVILVGHSYGGMVITGVAARIPGRMRRLFYIDAAIPAPGQSLFDIIRAGGCDPLSFEGLEPLPPYVEPIQFDPRPVNALPKIYLRCTQSEFAIVSTYAAKKLNEKREENHWLCLELPTTHTPMLTMPERTAEILLEYQ
jgi:pimeloyl-ACP methyl ester carboxylesterase